MTQPVLCHCLVLVLFKPKTSQISSQRHTALCCLTQHMHGLILVLTLFKGGRDIDIRNFLVNVGTYAIQLPKTYHFSRF